ncbi:MAG: hypothetical protein Q8L48_25615 [Archangium sp.]|nr:hypothetical protein [Archangium sp.]
MPIEELTNEDVLQRCTACQSATRVRLATLSVGVGSAVPEDIDGRVLRLPACTTCKAEEFLIRSLDGQPMPTPGSYSHLHRLLVDQLHAQLAKAGRVDKRLGKLKLPELSAANRKEFFLDGLKLPAPPPEKLERSERAS